MSPHREVSCLNSRSSTGIGRWLGREEEIDRVAVQLGVAAVFPIAVWLLTPKCRLDKDAMPVSVAASG